MKNEIVVILHGLFRTDKSMKRIGDFLACGRYGVYNMRYHSTAASIDEIINSQIHKVISQPELKKADKIHFVTHSMGAIVLRRYLELHELPNIGNVVMLAPPNNGSELVDFFTKIPIVKSVFKFINGPAGMQLGINPGSFVNKLKPWDPKIPLGIIAGNKSTNPLYSIIMGGEGDGKVSVKSAAIDGMKDMIILPYPHTFIMNKKDVMEETLSFLRNSKFGVKPDYE